MARPKHDAAEKTPGSEQSSGVDRAGRPVEAELPESRLVEAARQGSQQAFGELVRRYERKLQSVIGRFIRDPDLVDDLTQDTFLRVYRKLDQFDTSRRFGPWLARIGVNLTLDHLRKQKRRGWVLRFSEFGVHHWPDPAIGDPRTSEDLAQEVHFVLQQIPEKYRVVLVLRDLEYFSTSEIAAILDRKEATIRWRLAEARNKFQEIWTQRGKERQHGTETP